MYKHVDRLEHSPTLNILKIQKKFPAILRTATSERRSDVELSSLFHQMISLQSTPWMEMDLIAETEAREIVHEVPIVAPSENGHDPHLQIETISGTLLTNRKVTKLNEITSILLKLKIILNERCVVE